MISLRNAVRALFAHAIVATGTESGWNYKKYADGTFEAVQTVSVALAAGTAWAGGYYHQQEFELAVPTFASSWNVVAASKQNAVIAAYIGTQKSSTGFKSYWLNGSSGIVSGSAFGPTTFMIEGTWQ